MMITKRPPGQKISSNFTKTTITKINSISQDDQTARSKNISSDSIVDMDLFLSKKSIHKSYHANFKQKMDTNSDSEVNEENVNFHKADLVGQGTYSLVYKAIDLLTGKFLALKVFQIPPQNVKQYYEDMKEKVNVCKQALSSKKVFL